MGEKTMARTLSVRIKNEKDYDKFIKKLEEEKGTSDRQIGPKIEELIHQYVTEDTQQVNKNNYQQLEKENKELQTKIEQLQQENNTLTKENTTINTKEQEKQENIQKLEEQNNILIQENEIKKAEASAANARYDTLNQQNIRLTDTISSINQELDKQRKENTTIRNDYKHGQEIIEKLHNDYNELEQENKQLNIIFAKITTMSLMQRILGQYPEEIKELTDGKQ